MRVLLLLAGCLALSGCYAGYGTSGGLISGQSPPNPYAANAEPQPPGSLPPGAEGIGASGPLQRFPDYASFTFPTPF